MKKGTTTSTLARWVFRRIGKAERRMQNLSKNFVPEDNGLQRRKTSLKDKALTHLNPKRKDTALRAHWGVAIGNGLVILSVTSGGLHPKGERAARSLWGG